MILLFGRERWNIFCSITPRGPSTAVLLDAGIEIYEYHESSCTPKPAVVDEHWATVGSSNIDYPYSLLLSREANVVVDDVEFAGRLKQGLKQAIETGARRISNKSLDRQTALSRFMNWLSYGLVRLLMGISGYDHEYGQAEWIERRRRRMKNDDRSGLSIQSHKGAKKGSRSL